MYKRFLSVVLLVSTIISCVSDENFSPIPTLETVGSQVLSSGGVILKGNITNLGFDEIIEYGFELTAQSYNVNHQVELPANQGLYSLEILQGLYPGLEYNYRAYVRTESDIYRGETLSFISNGSASPVMQACLPSIAHVGDTVVLSGENFPTIINHIDLKFGNSSAQIISVTETELTFIVPRPEGNLRGLEISSYGNQAFQNGLLDLYQPVINSVNPSSAFFGENIVIIGDHFNNNVNYTSVTIGGFDAEVISTSRNEIQVIVPEDVNYSNSQITVYAQNQYVSYNGFSLSVPEFLNVPNSVYTDLNFLVTVDQTHENKNTFLINDKVYHPDIIDDTTLEFYIYSSQSFEQRENVLKWVLNDVEVVSSQTLNISNPFYKIKDGYNNNFPFAEYDVLTINDEAVIIGDIAYTTSAKYIYKYNDVTREWENQSLISDDDGSSHVFGYGGASFVYSDYSNYIYGLKGNGYQQNFIQVDINTGNVTLLTPNNQSGYYGKGFSHQNKVYYTLPNSNNLWAYNIDTENWSIVSTLPYNISENRNKHISLIVVDDYVYITNGSNDSQYNDFWKMNLNTYQWEQLPDNPSPSRSATVYKRNNKLHFVTTEIWIYDLLTQNWEIMPNPGITSNVYDHGMDAFIQNNIPYLIYREDASNISYLNLFMGDLVD